MPNDSHNIDAEKTVLGCCLVDAGCRMEIFPIIRSDDFFHPPYRMIYDAILDLDQQHRGIDLVTVADYVLKNKIPVGVEIIAGLSDYIPHVRHAIHYAEIVREHGMIRRLNRFGSEIQGYTNSNGHPPRPSPEIINFILSRVMEISGESKTEIASQDLIQIHGDMNRLAHTKKSMDLIKPGYPHLDKIVSLMPGEVCVIAGRTSNGKSTLALNFGYNVAKYQKRGVLVISLEMSLPKLIHRLSAMITGYQINDFRFGRFYREEGPESPVRKTLESTLESLRNRIIMRFTPDADEIDIERICRREMLRTPGIGLVIIDYLQLVTCSERSSNERTAINKISRRVKQLAGLLGISIILISQLARPQGIDRSKNRVPSLYDMKETGNIEQDADCALLLHLLEIVEDNAHLQLPDWNMDLIVAKQRDGLTGKVPFILHRGTSTFEEIAIPC